MRKSFAVLALAAFVFGASLQPAKAEGLTTETLAYTVVFALAGTAAGVALMPMAARRSLRRWRAPIRRPRAR